ncbi:hypothetical protein GW17_00024199 [Ensete ventricosum]|nr:hypothetical protein GW17_00024199 [Ensete ventricosum]RZS03071.1 hypothetical protein BHM03_00033192 [Ensete ventricosum]
MYDQSDWRVGLLQCLYSLKRTRKVRGQGRAARKRGGQPRPAPMQGRPPTARPRPRLAPMQGRRLRAWRAVASLQERQPLIAGCPQRGRLQGGTRRWRPLVASPQGAAARSQVARGDRQRPALPPAQGQRQ